MGGGGAGPGGPPKSAPEEFRQEIKFKGPNSKCSVIINM